MSETNKNEDMNVNEQECENAEECQECEQEAEATENGLEKEVAELKDRYMRLQAEFMNYKKRTEREKQSIYKYANQPLMGDLLESLDNMERAIKSVDEDSKDNALYEGVEMVYNQVLEIFKKHNLEEIEAIDCKFDPNNHHAVMQDTVDEDGEDIVTDVFQKGYKLHDRVIRPSVVKVSKIRK